MLGVLAIFVITSRTGIVERWERFVEGRIRAYVIFTGDLFEEVIHFGNGYGVADILISSGLSGISIATFPFDRTGFVVLGISGHGGWTPTPSPERILVQGHRLTVFGKLAEIRRQLRDVSDGA